MNYQRLSLPLISVFVVLLVGGLVYLAASQQPSEEAGGVAPTSTTATTPAGSPSATATAAPASAPSYSKDSMNASVVGGVIPFSSSFSLRLNASRSCSTVTYTVNFGDNTERDVQVPKEQCAKLYSTVLNHQYERAGIFTATLRTKPVSGTGVTLSQITITAKEPVVTSGTKTATFATVPTTGTAPLNVALTLSASDSANSTVNYTLVFGDGQTGTFPQTAAPKVSHLYSNPGTYVVSVSKRTQCVAGQCAGSSLPVGTINITVN